MNLLASGFANFINGIFANWQMILFVILAVLLLMTIAFRKFKLTAIIMGAIAIAIGVVLIIDLVIEAMKWDLVKLVSFLVRWVPTVLFAATVILATLIGVCRGLRKSLILLAHEVGAAAICIILYAVLVNMEAVDGFMLKFVDMFFGGSGGLCSKLGVTAPCEGLKYVFVEWLPTVIQGDFAIMLGGSKAYIYTLADLIYHVAFALLLFVAFLIIDFIMYIIYHCCYPERKYKRKIAVMYTQNKVDRRYSRHWIGGGVVGLTRGIVIGILSLSFLGTAFYVVAGRGEGKLTDYDLGNEQYNQYYSVYRSIESYGTFGIFKVLNAISSTEDMPYYLFAADLVFSGELDDDEFGITENIVFRKELDAYTGFARDTMALLIKYGGDDIAALVNDKATESAFDVVLGVMSNEQFRVEFNDLISEFDTQTYVINFAMSFVNSAIANIDDVSFASGISAENRDLLQMLFTKGYLSDVIPDESATKLAGKSVTLPYVNISKLVTKKDVQIIFNVVLDLMTKQTSDTTDVLNLISDILPKIKQVSVLNDKRAEELDPVLGRLYCYAANRFLTEEGSLGVTYTSIYRENIEWIDEINSLLDVSDASFKLCKNVLDTEKPLDSVISIFDESNPDYDENIKAYDSIARSVYKSRIIGKTLATSKIYTVIKDGLGSLFEGGIYLPKDIVYESTFDSQGKLVSAGEMYHLINGVGAIGKYSELLPMLADFDKDKDLDTLLDAITDLITVRDTNGYTVSEYLVESTVLRSLISATLISLADDFVYVPNLSREADAFGNKVRFITKEELTTLFKFMPELVDFVKPVINGGKDIKDAVAEFIEDDTFDKIMKESGIFQGTLAKNILNALGDDDRITIPMALKKDLDGWVTVGKKSGELKQLLNAIDIVGISISDIINGDFNVDTIKDNVLSLKEEELEKTLNSQVLHYTVSKYLINDKVDFGSMKLIVPKGARRTLERDTIDALVKKEELQCVLKVVNGFDLSEDTDVTDVMTHLVKNKSQLKDSYVLSASIVYTLTQDSQTADMLKLSQVYADAASLENLENYGVSNPWKNEIVRLIDALDEILGISSSAEFSFNEEELKDKLSDMLRDLNGASQVNGNVTKLKVCYASEVVRNNITTRLDDMLGGKIDENLILSAKSRGYYTEKELEALSNALNVFDIDVMDEDSDYTGTVKSKILSLNQPSDKFGGKSELNVVYPSVIFSGMMSKELDKILLDEGDTEATVSDEQTTEPGEGGSEEGGEEPTTGGPLIDRSVLYAIKGGKIRYSEEEISNLINAVRAFGITDFDKLNMLDIDDVKNNTDAIDEMCLSLVMRGVFTKQVRANNQLNVDHELAYEEGIKVLKTQEIRSLIELVKEVNADDMETMYFDDVSISAIRDNAFEEKIGDEPVTVKSYLILSAISDRIKENNHLIVSRDLIDDYGCVRAAEVYNLINAFIAIEGDEENEDSLSIGGWSENKKDEDGNVTEFGGSLKYPDNDQKRDTAFTSEIIRAKLTEQFIAESEKDTGNENLVGAGNIREFTDYRTGSVNYLISVEELAALFNAIDFCRGSNEGTFAIPALSYELLRSYYKTNPNSIDLLFASDVLRYRIGDLLVKEYSAWANDMEAEDAFSLKTHKAQSKNAFDDVAKVKEKLSTTIIH